MFELTEEQIAGAVEREKVYGKYNKEHPIMSKQKDRPDRENKLRVMLHQDLRERGVTGPLIVEGIISQIIALFPKPLEMPELRKELIGWITAYKDVTERNALAENPDESAEYLISLIEPLIEEAKREERERIIEVIENLNSIGYPYGGTYKEAVLITLREEK